MRDGNAERLLLAAPTADPMLILEGRLITGNGARTSAASLTAFGAVTEGGGALVTEFVRGSTAQQGASLDRKLSRLPRLNMLKMKALAQENMLPHGKLALMQACSCAGCRMSCYSRALR